MKIDEKERVRTGFDLLLQLGVLIDDAGEDNDGNIGIFDLDYPKFRLVENILLYMNVLDMDSYELLYDDEFYIEFEDTVNINIFNHFTNGMIIKKKEIEKKFNL